MSAPMRFQDKRVFVTGAAGFIGAQLVRQLLKEGADIYALVSLKSELYRLKDISESITIVKADLTDPNSIYTIVKKLKPQIIYHLASYGTQPTHTDLGQMTNVNITGLTNLLTALEDIEFECFVNTGSSAEYGPKNQPMKENQLLEANTFYGATKAAASLLLQAFGKLHKRRAVTLRLFYVYGPGEELTRLIPTIIRTCLQGSKLPLTSIHEKKDFIFIEDVIQAYLNAALIKGNETYILNVGTSIETNLGQLIKMIEKLTGKKINFVEGAYESRRWDSDCWAADIENTKKVLNWKPHYDLETGLSKTIDWLRSKDTLSCPSLSSKTP